MQCERCQAPITSPVTATPPWCKTCEYDYDGWSRQHSSDILWQLGGAAVVVSAIALGLPILGVSTIIAAAGIFAGFGTLFALNRVNQRRRRRQFLATGGVPRASLLPPGAP